MAPTEDEAMDAARKAASGGPGQSYAERIADRIGAKAGVSAVFGTPIERGDVTVIPVARVRWGFGGGEGRGEEADSTGSGSGGGGGVSAEPIGFIEIGRSGAEFRPIIPPYPSPVFLLAMGITAALILRALARMIRR